ncbi:MAG: FHA domain-containing protein [Lachnospiraceae bacterium]|nr:FHA domain-containing protein [Lachnospiraceae bacterium]
MTDGEDDSDDINGKDNDKDTTLENVRNSAISVYGILLNNNTRYPNKEKIKFTKNKILKSDNGHGYYYNCSADTSAEIVKKAFKKMNTIFRKETYVVNLSADTNKALTGKKELILTVNNQAMDPVMLDYSNHDQDTDAPAIIGSVKKVGKNAVTFSLEDTNGVNLSDASDQIHYSIQMDDEDEEGKVWTIDQVNVNQNNENVSVTLTVKDKEFYNGDYTLTVDGIRDESQEQNAMTKVKASFNVEDGLDPEKEARKEFLQQYWWIAFILIMVIIGVIVIIIVKKKSVKIVEKEVNPEKLNQADSKMIRLTITDRAGTIKDVEWNVEGSLFVGRSDICNIFFDDDRLSKQHFVIEVIKMGCYIEDLESTNGTFVNGVKMINRRLLLDGDVITAGREKIVFHVERNQVLPEEAEKMKNMLVNVRNTSEELSKLFYD